MGGLDLFRAPRNSDGTCASRVSSDATSRLEPSPSRQKLSSGESCCAAPYEVPATHRHNAMVSTRRGTIDRSCRLFIPMSSSAVEQAPREHQREQHVANHRKYAA